MINNEIYLISNEFNVTQLLAHFDSDYVIGALEEKLNDINYTSSLEEVNIVASFEQNFKMMENEFPGDSQNIKMVREQVYRQIIDILCDKFNLKFNNTDEFIDLYSAAFYLYDFTVSKRNINLINFITSFIINNKDSLYQALDLDSYRKNKDSTTLYNKHIYTNNKFALISANIEKVINYIATFDIKLLNIFQSVYINQQIVMFLDNAFADNGNFFKDYYYSMIINPILAPRIITDIRFQLQKIYGDIGQENLQAFIKAEQEKEENN